MTIDERNKIVEDNLPLVISRVMQLNKGIYNDDFFQAGCIGLILAVERFKPELGNKLSTFAAKYIDGYIKTHRNKDSIIKPIGIIP